MLFNKLVEANKKVWEEYVDHEVIMNIDNIKDYKFENYLIQDKMYLRAYNNCFKHIATNAQVDSEIKYFTLNQVNEIEAKLTNEVDEGSTILPVTSNYINYMYEVMATGTHLQKLVALAPCTIGYAQFAINAKKHICIESKYYEWIETYADESFQSVAKEYEDILNEYQPTRDEFKKLSKIFNKVCKLEIDFFKQLLAIAPPKVLTIAGSDSSGGAGIQADLKTINSHNCYGTSVITAVTSQSTTGVYDIGIIDNELISSQIKVVLDDMNIDCVKVGMLANEEVVKVVASSINNQRVVLDPVMVAKDGSKLIDDNGVDAIIEKLFPLSYLITPNIEEAKVLTGIDITSVSDMKEACKVMYKLGAKNVLCKGGHLDDDILTDVLFDGKSYYQFNSKRISTRNTHGTGCSLSSAIASNLAKEMDIAIACKLAIEYVQVGIITNYKIGHGKGPINHFYMLGENNE